MEGSNTQQRGDRETQAEVQALIARLRQYEAQTEEISKELALVGQAISEVEKAIETIKNIKDLKEGDELLVWVGAGWVIYTRLSNPGKVIVGVGAGVNVEKSPDDAIESLNKRKKELEDGQARINENLQRIGQEAQMLQNRLQQIISEQGRRRSTEAGNV